MTDTHPSDPQGADPGRPSLEEEVALRTAELAAAKDATEAALAAKSTFLARMSHEIRTPMNTIIGLNHIMLRDVTDPRLRQQIDKVLGAAEQLLGLIDDILELSRIEAGQVTLAHGDFSPRQVLEGVCALVASQLDGKGLELRVEVDADVPRTLRGDAGRLRQLLLNFATNAAKFTERGHVRFAASCRTRRGDARAWMCFTVEDTGIGMTPEQQARAFHPFEQGDGGYSRRHGGAGLGLALCQRLAQLMGGHVTAESEPGRGSTFRFEAPFERGAAQARTGSVEEPDTGMHRALEPEVGRRILLVDDNLLNLEVAEALLRMDGYDVDLARDGVEAVERARERAYAAILIDVQMPRMDGLEATHRIRQIRRHAATPVIAMTASVFEEDRRVCREAGMNELVAKPVEPTHLSRVMSRWAPLPAAARARKQPHAEAQAAGAGAAAETPPGAGRDRLQLLELQRLVAADDLTAREYFRTLPRQVTEPRHAELDAALEVFDHERAGVIVDALLHGGMATVSAVTGTRIATAAGTFEVRVDGPEGAPWLVLSNSLGATLGMWEPQLPALTRHWRVLRYDTRGHGRSDVPPGPYTIAQLGADVLGLMDALGIGRAHCCGLSMGGTTALWLAAHAPERLDRVVLCNTQPWFGPPEVLDARIATVRRAGLGALVDATLQRWFTPEFREVRPDVVDRIRQDVLATPLAGYVACCEALRDVDLRDALPRIEVPVLVIAGSHDPAPTPEVARGWAAQVPGARFLELPAAHLSNLGATEEFNDAVAGFLAGP